MSTPKIPMKNNPMADKDLEKSDLLNEYDFSNGVRGKYAKQYAEGTNVVVLSPDVAKVFPNSDAVNEALRSLIAVAHQAVKTP